MKKTKEIQIQKKLKANKQPDSLLKWEAPRWCLENIPNTASTNIETLKREGSTTYCLHVSLEFNEKQMSWLCIAGHMKKDVQWESVFDPAPSLAEGPVQSSPVQSWLSWK